MFAVPFVILGVRRVDPAAQGWAVGFRILIIPGVTAFWPLFAIRLLRGKRHPTERTAHRTLAAKSHSHPRRNRMILSRRQTHFYFLYYPGHPAAPVFCGESVAAAYLHHY